MRERQRHDPCLRAAKQRELCPGFIH